MGERDEGRRSFDAVAERYQRARPEYPAELFDALVEMAGLRDGAHLLEVGCATGKATLPLARRGFRITAIELGESSSAVARANLHGYPNVDIVNANFEEWEPANGERVDLVFAATAWHWIDPAIRYEKAARLLAPGGNLAFWSATHAFPKGGDPFFREIQDVYERIGDALPPGTQWLAADELPDERAEIAATRLFEPADVRRFGWVVDYTADAYIDLLDTFSANLVRPARDREYLYAEIRRRLAARPDPLLHRGWGAVLHVAKRRP